MSTLANKQKEHYWQEMANILMQVKDKQGKEIDAGIFETVVALNVLDIPTFASCEGHLDWGTGAPWVDIASEHPATQISIGTLSTEALLARESGDMSPDEIDKLFNEVHKHRREVKKYHIQERQKLLAYLALFYQGRNVPYDQRLIIRPLGTNGKCRLESQGADCQECLPLDERAYNLIAYQAEMHGFTNFLKNYYFQKMNHAEQ